MLLQRRVHKVKLWLKILKSWQINRNNVFGSFHFETDAVRERESSRNLEQHLLYIYLFFRMAFVYIFLVGISVGFSFVLIVGRDG